MPEDYYNILGVNRTATQEEVKRAYRRLAHKHHPDRPGGNAEKFKQINAAYEILSDREKRQQYDQYGRTFEEGTGGFGAQTDFGGFADFAGMEDLLGQFFGRSHRTRAQRTVQGSDAAMDITISFKESAQGVKREVTHRIYQTCQHCGGKGAESGTASKVCDLCKGTGQIASTRQTLFGVFTQNATCSRCHGEGKMPEKLCSQCQGQGRILVQRSLQIDIPAGIGDGQVIRITGKGEVGPRGGPAGDLYVNVHVTPHLTLQRDGDDVRSAATIPFVDAILGTTVNIETLEGLTELSIPAGTQPNTAIKLPRRGFPALGGSRRGDHVVTVAIELPKKISRKQRALLEEFKKARKTFLF